MRKKSFTFLLLRKFGFDLSEGDYQNIGFFHAISRGIKNLVKAIILKYCMYSVFLSPLNYRIIRPKLWRILGAKIGKRVFIGYDVWMDFNNSHLIEIKEGAHITNRCLLLCHQRDLKNYFFEDDATKLPYTKGKIVIGKNVMIGMGTTIMPNVKIGEGSIIASGSIVTKDIPAWTLAAGSPAKIIRKIKNRD